MNSEAFIYLGGSFPQLAGLMAVKRSGLHVVLVDRDKNCPGRQIADQFWCVSVDDSAEIRKRTEVLCSTHNVVGAYGVADYACISIENVYDFVRNQKVSPSVFAKFVKKHTCKELFEKAEIDCPQTFWIGQMCPSSEQLSKIKFEGEKLVIKPSSSYNSQGVSIEYSSDLSKIQNSIKNAFKFSDTVLIEQFVCGKQINVDGLMINSEFYLISLTERYDQISADFEFHCAKQLTQLSAIHRSRVSNSVKSAAMALQYFDGPLTADCVVDGTSLNVLEISPHLHSVKLESFKDVRHPLSVWTDALTQEKGGKIYLDEMFSSETQVGYLMVYARKTGILKVNYLKLRATINRSLIFDSYEYKKSGDKVFGAEPNTKSLLAIFWFGSIDDASVISLKKTISEAFEVLS